MQIAALTLFKKRYQKKLLQNLIYILFAVLLILSATNLYIFGSPKKTRILGIEAKNDYGIFWFNFLEKNPDYIPGWIEIERSDKVKSIDPNYF